MMRSDYYCLTSVCKAAQCIFFHYYYYYFLFILITFYITDRRVKKSLKWNIFCSLYQTNLFSYICRTSFINQCISVALQYFIIMLFCHQFCIYPNPQGFGFCTWPFCDFDWLCKWPPRGQGIPSNVYNPSDIYNLSDIIVTYFTLWIKLGCYISAE